MTELEAKVAAFNRAIDIGNGKGALEIYVIRYDDPRLLNGILRGDAKTLRIFGLVEKFLCHLSEAPNSKICLCCECQLSATPPPPTIVLCFPFAKDWIEGDSMVLMVGACPACSTKTDNELATIMTKSFPGGECISSAPQ